MLIKYLKLKIFFLLLLLPHAVFSQSNDLDNQGEFNAAYLINNIEVSNL